MIRITHPRPQQGRQSALGVEFVDGIATVESLHPEREQALFQHGYEIEYNDIVDLTMLSRRELRDIAEIEGVAVTSKMTRDQLIKAISELPAAPIDDPNAVQE